MPSRLRATGQLLPCSPAAGTASFISDASSFDEGLNMGVLLEKLDQAWWFGPGNAATPPAVGSSHFHQQRGDSSQGAVSTSAASHSSTNSRRQPQPQRRTAQPRPVSFNGLPFAAASPEMARALASGSMAASPFPQPSVFAMSISHDDPLPLRAAVMAAAHLKAAPPVRPQHESTMFVAAAAAAAATLQAQQLADQADAPLLPQLLMPQLPCATSTLAPQATTSGVLSTDTIASITYAASDISTPGPASPTLQSTASRPWEALSAHFSNLLSGDLPQEQSDAASLPTATLPILPILMASPGSHHQLSFAPGSAPVLGFPLSGSIGSGLMFPIAAAAQSMHMRSAQCSTEALQSTLPPQGGCKIRTSSSAPLYQVPRYAEEDECEYALFAMPAECPMDIGAETEVEDAAACRSHSQPSARGQIQAEGSAALIQQQATGVGADATPAGEASAGSRAAATDRSCNFWKGLAAAAAAVDGNIVRQPAGPRGAEADMVIPWKSPIVGQTRTMPPVRA